MNKTGVRGLVALLLIVVVLQVVLLFRREPPREVARRAGRSEQQFRTQLPDSVSRDSVEVSTLRTEIKKRFDRLDDRLTEIQNITRTLTEIDERIIRLEQQFSARLPDSARAPRLQSEMAKSFDRLDDRLAEIENLTATLTEIDQRVIRLGENLGARFSESSRPSTLQSRMDERFDRLDNRLAQIENKLRQ